METRLQLGPPSEKSTDPPKLTLLWFDISKLTSTTQFVLCCIGVFVFYLMYGYMLELIFTLDGLKPYGWYLTLIQFGYYVIFGWIEKTFCGIDRRKIPLKTYLILAFLTLGTMGFSNTSLEYLNYPTQVIFKCCKLIPVLIGGILIQRKKYGILDFLSAVLMCLGLALFTLADSYISPNFDMLGVLVISLALVCDAAIGNVQEKAMKGHSATNTEVVFYSYSIGFCYLLVIMLVTGKFFSGFSFCLKHPWPTYGYGLVFSATGYLGIQIVLTLVKTCGALAAATVTTCRKAFSIILSFLFFNKPFAMQYFWSGLLVLLGIYLSIYSKNKKDVTLKQLVTGFLVLCQGRRSNWIGGVPKKMGGVYANV